MAKQSEADRAEVERQNALILKEVQKFGEELEDQLRSVRETLGEADESAEIRQSLARIEKSLDKLTEQVGVLVASSAKPTKER